MDYILLFFEIDVEISRIDFFFLLSYYLFVQNIYFIDDNRLNNNVTSNEYSFLSLYHYWHLILASFQKKKTEFVSRESIRKHGEFKELNPCVAVVHGSKNRD